MTNVVPMIEKPKEITIPVVEICDGWSVDEVLTLDDCDDADLALTGALIAIDARIEMLTDGTMDDADLLRRTRAARRWKETGLRLVERKRAALERDARQAEHQRAMLAGIAAKNERIGTANSRLCEHFREHHPEAFRDALLALGMGVSA